MNDQHREFKYTELDGSKGEIRLLKILPGNPDDRIRIEISDSQLVSAELPRPRRWNTAQLCDSLPEGWEAHETLGGHVVFGKAVEGRFIFSREHPNPSVDVKSYERIPIPNPPSQYEALSYTWGAEQNSQWITVFHNGLLGSPYAMQVRPNLANALRHLRHLDKPRTMWIDALCINQGDKTERSHQVHLMGRIYSLAHKVIVWLGSGSEDSKLALYTLEELGNKYELTKDAYQIPLCENPDYDVLDHRIPLPYNDKIWTALANMFQRPWFERLWTLQESQLAHT